MWGDVVQDMIGNHLGMGQNLAFLYLRDEDPCKMCQWFFNGSPHQSFDPQPCVLCVVVSCMLLHVVSVWVSGSW